MRSEATAPYVKEWAELAYRGAAIQELVQMSPPSVKAWVYTVRVDGRMMELTLTTAPEAETCGHRSIEMFYECRLWPGHDGLHFPFTKELLQIRPDLVVTGMRSA